MTLLFLFKGIIYHVPCSKMGIVILMDVSSKNIGKNKISVFGSKQQL